MDPILEALNAHQREGTRRSLFGDSSLIDFSSNDYFGLSRCPRIRSRLVSELEAGCPLGSTGSRLLSGQTSYHDRVEAYLSKCFGSPSALLLSSGFMANLGVLGALGSLGAEFFSDELNHASLVDGMRFHRQTPINIFRHNDLEDLEVKLRGSQARLKVIVTESVFSMDGDLSPLRELRGLSEKFGSWLVVDEAHATGVFGKNGLGRLHDVDFEFDREKTVLIHTGGKALGGQGAFVLSGLSFRQLMIQRSRSFIYSTALAPISCLQIEFALDEILLFPNRGVDLQTAASEFRRTLPPGSSHFQSLSPIVPLQMGSNERALKTAKFLQHHGMDVRAIRSPTVKKGTERLRITLKSFHEPRVLSRLSTLLHQCLQEDQFPSLREV